MIPGQPSRTMVHTAVLRAVHQVLDEPRIFDDPIAVDFIPEAGRQAILAAEGHYRTSPLSNRRAQVALRSRFAEDRLADAIQRGVTQYVIAAVGLDTFPWRQPSFARSIRIFAADMPASLAVLQESVRRRGLPHPPNLTYVPVNLEERQFGEQLRAFGFELDAPMFCSALGVVQFLTAGAADALLTFAANAARGSEIVFSFSPPDDGLNDRELVGLRESEARGRNYGEPWLTRYRPEDLVARLRRLGFSDVVLLTPELAQLRYFGGSNERKVTRSGQVIAAVI